MSKLKCESIEDFVRYFGDYKVMPTPIYLDVSSMKVMSFGGSPVRAAGGATILSQPVRRAMCKAPAAATVTEARTEENELIEQTAPARFKRLRCNWSVEALQEQAAAPIDVADENETLVEFIAKTNKK